MRAYALAGALALLLWVLAGSQLKGLDPDFFWHLKVGELALAGQHPGLAEPFSWTAAGRYWLDHEWLGEVVWAWLFKLGGLPAVKALHWLLLGGLIGAVGLLIGREGARFRVAACSAAFIGCLLFPWYLPRLQVVSGLGLALTLLYLQAWNRGNFRPWMLVAYEALLIAWANLHGGGAIAGPGTLSIAVAVELVQKLRGQGRPGLRWLAATAAMGWLGLAVNPSTLQLPLFSIAAMIDPRIHEMNQIILEWHGFAFEKPFYVLYLAWICAIVLGLAAARKLPAPSLLAVGLVWAWMGFGAYRNIPLAAIATAPLWGAAVAHASRKAVVGLGAALAVALMALHPLLATRRADPLAIGERMPSAQALDALNAHAAGRKLLNWYMWGGEVLFIGYPRVKVFIDGRQYVYGLQTNRDYLMLATAGPEYQKVLAQYDVDAAFFPPEWPIMKALHRDPRWHTVFSDGSAELMLRAPR
ncbi:MAG: hypothetical protein JWM80_2574 [Cyanobacteria bacterium RYN_339]|nr:hypothetical protein [Cyanobacteria bacterium RYN_339]